MKYYLLAIVCALACFAGRQMVRSAEASLLPTLNVLPGCSNGDPCHRPLVPLEVKSADKECLLEGKRAITHRTDDKGNITSVVCTPIDHPKAEK